MPSDTTTNQKKVRAGRSDKAAADVSKQWQDVTDKLAAARTRQATCELACAEKIADGEDATEASAELQRAEAAVRQLESAVAVLWQRKEDAHAAVYHAKKQGR